MRAVFGKLRSKIMNIVIGIHMYLLLSMFVICVLDILQYYLKCSMGQTNPFQQVHNYSFFVLFFHCLSCSFSCIINWFSDLQKLSGSHKALVEMQDDVSELLRSAIREFPKTKV